MTTRPPRIPAALAPVRSAPKANRRISVSVASRATSTPAWYAMYPHGANAAVTPMPVRCAALHVLMLASIVKAARTTTPATMRGPLGRRSWPPGRSFERARAARPGSRKRDPATAKAQCSAAATAPPV
ncbi:hypothetical protein [Streptomyces cyaneofuscatus]|uniref:hypothetical protein n=1 Tax=Streptomyces cyaneofuscatus TaxID=66883 RepID=UPI0036BF985B